jgi:predicted site-specific integrase-resolvase
MQNGDIAMNTAFHHQAQTQPQIQQQLLPQSQSLPQIQLQSQQQPQSPTYLQRTVTLIPPDMKFYKAQHSKPKKQRTAAYCRVSTDDEEQLNSYNAQLSFYTDLINSNPEWTMCGVFADEGLSGLAMKNRTEFNKLIALCKKGKVDVILVKSISRFARNTLDSISVTRMLKSLGVAVIFEKDYIKQRIFPCKSSVLSV